MSLRATFVRWLADWRRRRVIAHGNRMRANDLLARYETLDHGERLELRELLGR